MMKATVQIVEDDQAILDMIAFAVGREGYTAVKCMNASEALEQASSQCPDIFLVDWGLPDLSGTELIRAIRRDDVTRDVPVIMLTARSEDNDKVEGLDAGADDYLTKPVSIAELLARIKAQLRRFRGFNKTDILSVGDLVLDIDKHEVTYRNQPIKLSITEFKLLKMFLTNPEKMFNREQILNRVWGRNTFVEDRTVDVHILRLRKVLKKYSLDNIIQTVRGAGYRLKLT